MLVVQDETAALAFSINRGQLYTNYPCGQEVVINLTDLWAGQYNALIQVGQLGDYQGQPQISFMPFVKFQSHTQLSGQPDRDFQYVRFGKEAPADKPYIISATLEEINSIAGAGKQYRNMMSQLVEIPNVRKDLGYPPLVTPLWRSPTSASSTAAKRIMPPIRTTPTAISRTHAAIS